MKAAGGISAWTVYGSRYSSNARLSAAPSVSMILSSAVSAALWFTTVLLNHPSVLSSPEL